MLYSGQYVETNRSSMSGSNGSIVTNTSMSRLQQVEGVMIEKGLQKVSRIRDFTNADIPAAAVSPLYRGQ